MTGGAGIGIVLISPQGRKYEFSLPIVATSTNNQAEYQALIRGLRDVFDFKLLSMCSSRMSYIIGQLMEFFSNA